MQRKTWHIAADFFLIGAVIPLLLLVVWNLFLEHHAGISAQEMFLKLALVLWPTGMQILVVPHAGLGYAVTIAIMLVQNAILYSVAALLVAWVLGRMRHHHTQAVRR